MQHRKFFAILILQVHHFLDTKSLDGTSSLLALLHKHQPSSFIPHLWATQEVVRIVTFGPSMIMSPHVRILNNAIQLLGSGGQEQDPIRQ